MWLKIFVCWLLIFFDISYSLIYIEIILNICDISACNTFLIIDLSNFFLKKSNIKKIINQNSNYKENKTKNYYINKEQKHICIKFNTIIDIAGKLEHLGNNEIIIFNLFIFIKKHPGKKFYAFV